MAKQEEAQAADPFSAWREWMSNSERQLNSFFNEMMGSDRYTQFLGRFTDLQISMQKNMNDALTRFFTSLNLPTRNDVIALNERLGAIEERLREIEAAVAPAQADDIAKRTAAARPPRTKRPPAAGGASR
jgi:polyhydroxyalkanoate synthesis regulator phasin